MPAFLRSRMFWIVIVVVAALGGGLVTLSNVKAAQQKAAAAKAAKAPPSPYAAIASGKADVEGGVIAVAARTAGIVRAVYVQEGDHVTRGQVLARQEDDAPRLAAQTAAADLGQARAAIVATQVQLRTAEREYRRLQALQASNFVAGQRLDQARDNIAAAQATLDAQRAAVDAAAARLAQARYQQELTVIRAPAEGRIARRYANPGAGASTLNVSTMFDLEPAAPRIVRAEVTEASVPAVAIGQSVELAAESEPGKVFKGRVMRRAAVFGARKLQSDDPSERTDDRVVEVVVSADGAPFIIGQRVLVKFMKGGVALAQQ
ncbi:MAG TPA: efflux RND transporter periplasmic adaptor subunit [Caulobacteraceae bacterium]|nr:efflux RND transporter periplasmic adaptor subunit [Caulobacteraceae bacterium]